MALAYAIIIPLGGIAIYLGATLSMAALILAIGFIVTLLLLNLID